MTYNEAERYIQKINKLGNVPGLDSVKKLLDKLGNPQNELSVIHIAGTNGKGSVFAFLEDILLEAGFKVGRYISPTIFTYLERFQINKTYMSKEDFAKFCKLAKNAADEMVKEGYNRPTSFETETAIAFSYFLENKVDVVLLETGMGGALDATNVVKKPLCTVFASISMDHMQFLGDSLEKIFAEKLGIMRKGVPAVTYELPDNLKKLWENKCQELMLKGLELQEKDISNINFYSDKTNFYYKDIFFSIKTLGSYQIKNACLAIMTAQVLRKKYKQFSILQDKIIQKGISKTIWKGRFQHVEESPDIYIDGAHNEGGWKSLAESIKLYFEGRNIIFIIGVLADKEYEKMIKILKPFSDTLICVTPDNLRALPKEELKRAATGSFSNIYLAQDVLDARKMGVELTKNKEAAVIVVCGSLSFIGPLIN